ncbi:hypothetical protein MHYP_G00126470 [Metynnis hypsauchen]
MRMNKQLTGVQTLPSHPTGYPGGLHKEGGACLSYGPIEVSRKAVQGEDCQAEGKSEFCLLRTRLKDDFDPQRALYWDSGV